VEIFDGRSLDLLAGFGWAWKFWWSDDRMIGFTLPGRRWVIYSYKDGQFRLESSGDLELDGRLETIFPAELPGTFVAAIKQGDSDDKEVGKKGFALIRIEKDSATVSNKTYFSESADITLDPDSDTCAVKEGIAGPSSLWDTSTGKVIAKSSTASPSIVTMEGLRKFLSPDAAGGLELIHLKRPYRREPLKGASAAALESARNVWGVEAHDIEGGWVLKLGWNNEAISLILKRDGDSLRVIAEYQGELETDSSGPKKVIRIKDKDGKVLFERIAGPFIREPAVEAGLLTLEAQGRALEFLRTHDLHPGEYHSNGESLFMARRPLSREETLAFLEEALLQENPARQAPEPFVVDRSLFASAEDPAFRMLADDFNLRAASPFDSTTLREAVSTKIAADSSKWDSWSNDEVSDVYPAEHPLTALAVAYLSSLRKERTYPTESTLDDLAWISVRRLLREQPSAALSPVVQRDCLLAATWLRKMNGVTPADDLVARCLELNPANLDALRAEMGHLKPDDSRSDARIRDLAGHKDAILADLLNAAYEAAKLEKTALAGEILAAAEKRHPGKVTENPMAGWILINLGKAADAHRIFEEIRKGIPPAQKPSEDLWAGLAISSWLDGRREDAIASYTAMIREEKEWVSSERIRIKAWPEKEAGPMEDIRLAVLDGNAEYRELAMIHPLGNLAFRAVIKARETPRPPDPAAWAYEQKNAAFWIEEGDKETARPLPPGMEREISQRVLDFYRGALEVYTITEYPAEWVEAEYKLALALSQRCIQFDPAERTAMLDEAIRRCSALTDVLSEGVVQDAAQSFADVTGTLSYIYLQANRPREAKEQALKGLARAPDKFWIATNLALAHLLSDEWNDAEALMMEYGDEILKDLGKSFWKIVEEDLSELERHGINHPNIARMRTYIDRHFSLGKTE
jgi:tetratricopeptide (TPR) repeat protein